MVGGWQATLHGLRDSLQSGAGSGRWVHVSRGPAAPGAWLGLLLPLSHSSNSTRSLADEYTRILGRGLGALTSTM